MQANVDLIQADQAKIKQKNELKGLSMMHEIFIEVSILENLELLILFLDIPRQVEDVMEIVFFVDRFQLIFHFSLELFIPQRIIKRQ
jgi:hypothetical protein